MSNKKTASKITLGMLKGKSVTTSVPTIAVRFNATAEEIEELYQSEDDGSEPTNSEQTKSTGDVEGSPLRYLPRLGKRSASTDNSLTSHDASPTSDPWKFFAGIKGKITKNIEDKITEIKQRNEEGDTASKKTKGYKDNLSDSEDISESSISKTCGAASTTEGVEMSTDEDTSSFENDKKVDENPQQAQLPIHDTSSATSPNLRQRFVIKQKGKDESDSYDSLVSLNTLGKLIELQTGVNPSSNRQIISEAVESGVEALEDGLFQNEVPSESNMEEEDVLPEELFANITEKIDNLKIEDGNAIVVQPISGDDIKQLFAQQSDDKVAHSFFAPEGFVDLRGTYLRSRPVYNLMYSLRRFLAVLCVLIAYIYAPIPVYLSGFIAGMLLSLTIMVIYNTFFSLNTQTTGYINKPILSSELLSTVPQIKEHIPISSYEGWMNEYPDLYNPLTYHISQTQSVYVKLQGNFLRVSHARAKIPKRAMWDEPKHKMAFTHHRIYNLLGAKIMLLPEGLHRKRQWSKKYPICIILNKDQINFEYADEISQTNSNHGNGKKENQQKNKQKKKTVMQPQVYSKLNEENLDMDFHLSTSSTTLVELEQTELDSLGMRLSENLLDDEDYLSNTLPIQDEDQPDEETIDIDWSTYSQLVSPTETQLHLFGRTGREKEDWFRRLTSATHKGCEIFSYEVPKSKTDLGERVSETLIQTTHTEANYLRYMSQFIKSSKRKKGPVGEDEYLRAVNVLWLNAVIGRILYDWSRDMEFTNVLREKIHRKLMSIRLPYFIEQLSVSELSLGDTSPLIHNAGKPVLDQKGLWVDLDMSYQGNIVLTLQTKLNLMKLKNPQSAYPTNYDYHPSAKWQSSDVEDTAESSTEDDGRLTPPPKVMDDKSLPTVAASGSTTKSKKVMRFVDKIAESKIFQAATDNRYIKRAMEGVSNTDLSLKVEIKGLIGTLVLNFPPPPSDRVWIGFRPAPKMFLTAQPMVGVRNMSFIRYLTNWIEKKLCKEFQKLMVIPNMEDFSIPHMSSELPK